MKLTQFIVTLAIALLASAFTAKLCSTRWNGNFVKICIAGCILSALATVSSVIFNGFGMHNVQTILLCCIFLYASYGDIKTHEADDFIHVIVLAVALIAKPAAEFPNALLAAVVAGGVMLLAAVLVGGMGIGGADVKFVAAASFLTTIEGGLFALGLGTLAALLCNSPFRKKKEGAGEGFPMLPYLSCSYMLIYLLS